MQSTQRIKELGNRKYLAENGLNCKVDTKFKSKKIQEIEATSEELRLSLEEIEDALSELLNECDYGKRLPLEKNFVKSKAPNITADSHSLKNLLTRRNKRKSRLSTITNS